MNQYSQTIGFKNVAVLKLRLKGLLLQEFADLFCHLCIQKIIDADLSYPICAVSSRVLLLKLLVNLVCFRIIRLETRRNDNTAVYFQNMPWYAVQLDESKLNDNFTWPLRKNIDLLPNFSSLNEMLLTTALLLLRGLWSLCSLAISSSIYSFKSPNSV